MTDWKWLYVQNNPACAPSWTVRCFHALKQCYLCLGVYVVKMDAARRSGRYRAGWGSWVLANIASTSCCVNTLPHRKLSGHELHFIIYWWQTIIGGMQPLPVVKGFNIFEYILFRLDSGLVTPLMNQLSFQGIPIGHEWKKLCATRLSQQLLLRLMLWIMPCLPTRLLH